MAKLANRSASKAKTQTPKRRLALRKPQPPVASPPSIPRTPMRGRGKLRHRALIDATEALLIDSTPEDVGLYQIAEKAGVPPASVYHFFPSKEAAFLALSTHYVEQLFLKLAEPFEAAAVRSWQDLGAIDMRRSMRFHNDHLPMMKINYGGFGSVSSRTIDDAFAKGIAATQYSRLNTLFHMPSLRSAEHIFEMRVAIIDAIWGVSYRRHGEITDWYFSETTNAVNAFMLQFLPARVEPREALSSAAARGDRISLPFGTPSKGLRDTTSRSGRRKIGS